MDCQAASELLPWLLNGSLDAGESASVQAHLAGCARCRGELAEERRAAAIFGSHLSTAAILDLAWERPPEGVDPALARRHIENCPACREELALASESRRLESEGPAEVVPIPRPARPRWALPAALAAGLLVGLLAGRLAVPVAPPVRDEQARARVAALETELAGLRGTLSALQDTLREARLPQLNLPLFELLPESLVVRGGAGALEGATEVVVPAGATRIALLLGADASPGTATLAIEDGTGREVWRGAGLVHGPPGGYTLTVPAELLPDGGYRITVRPERGKPVGYRLRVRGAR